MPTLKCTVRFPATLTGRWHVENPVGTKVYEEYFSGKADLSTQMTTEEFSALVFVDSGISRTTYPPPRVEERKIRQVPDVVVDPEPKRLLRIGSTVNVVLNPEPQLSYSNKIRTVVSVSAG
jgi:hypothetical protein